jgi:hypothetical protein
VEAGLDENFDWHGINVHIVTGGEFIPETYRIYLYGIMGKDISRPEEGLIGISMGAAEIGLGLFFEFYDLILLRQFFDRNKDILARLCGCEIKACPEVMQYFPQMYYLETPGKNEEKHLVVTILDKKKIIPHIRYDTGDIACILEYSFLSDELRKADRKDLVPKFKLPVGIHWGRAGKYTLKEGWISANEVKEALYVNQEAAFKLTGGFRIVRRTREISLNFQMKEGYQPGRLLIRELNEALSMYVPNVPKINLIPFRDFTETTGFDFQRKCRYGPN